MMRAWGRVGVVAGAAFLLAAMLLPACDYGGTDPSTKGGVGITEDVGTRCEFICDEVWCFKKNYPECTSQLCVGQPENLYCSVPCLNDASCPDGFRCTDRCDMAPESSGYCVFDVHYDLLIEFGVCPEDA